MWTTLKQTLSKPFSERFNAWIKSRVPRRTDTEFNQRRIYIVPSKAGLGLLLLFCTIVLLGINFQNNLVFMVAFWLLALLTVNILFTYRNLSGLRLKAIHAEPCFSGERALFWFEISEHQGRDRPSIYLGWALEDHIMLNLTAGQTLRVCLSYPSQKRGWLVPDRLTVLTRYPTGLARAWGYFLPDIKALIYPKPILLSDIAHQHGSDPNQSSGREIPMGSHDFSGIRKYRTGDSLKQIHWPQYAKTGQLASREFVDYQQEAQWLDWSAWHAFPEEVVLSHFCARVLQYHQENVPWGLKLPQQSLAMATGDAHRIQSLTALALTGISAP